MATKTNDTTATNDTTEFITLELSRSALHDIQLALTMATLRSRDLGRAGLAQEFIDIHHVVRTAAEAADEEAE